MGIMVTSSTKKDNMSSDSFLKIWIFQNFQNFLTSNDLKIKWNPGYIRLYPVQSGQIQLNPVDFDIKTDVLKCFWRTKFILSGILAEILSIFGNFLSKVSLNQFWNFFEVLFSQNVSLLSKYERPWICFLLQQVQKHKFYLLNIMITS